ncbi:MAG: hypothetical protein LBH28_09680 [Oscillospiraceae bacterium]|nr:hypothetical protein [Oscillospiraceae bacterium]
MKKILLILLTGCVLFFSGVNAFAEQDFPQPEDAIEDVPYAFQRDVECFFSEPTVTQEGGGVVYKTTLYAKDMSEFYGYQIQVSSATGESVEIENKAGGVTTPAVYQNEKLNFAVIVGEGASGDVEVCEITSKYPYADKNRERTLVVDKLDIVTSIAAERTVTLGPSPAALTLVLPYVPPPFYVTIWFPIVFIAGLLLGGIFLYMQYRKKRPQPSAHDSE